MPVMLSRARSASVQANVIVIKVEAGIGGSMLF